MYLPSDSQERHVQECSRDKHSAESGVPVPDNGQFYIVVCLEPPWGGILHGIEEQGIMNRLGQDGEKKIQQLGAFVLTAAISPGWPPLPCPDQVLAVTRQPHFFSAHRHTILAFLLTGHLHCFWQAVLFVGGTAEVMDRTVLASSYASELLGCSVTMVELGDQSSICPTSALQARGSRHRPPLHC